ncbi:hypothetical protein QF048_007580 [Streptomyces sp. W4I9-2]|nr:hypothetical protein [Streptomyces sp. W4I9-2]
MMMAERGMSGPAAGGSVLARFDTILAATVPELTGRVKAVAFDTGTGRLDVVPDSPAVGTKLRWSTPNLIAAVNEKVPGTHVRSVHVLAPAAVKDGPATAATATAPQPTASAASPVERRTPPDGYRRAIAALRHAARPSRADPHIAKAVERQSAALRALSHRAFPEPGVGLSEHHPREMEEPPSNASARYSAGQNPGGEQLVSTVPPEPCGYRASPGGTGGQRDVLRHGGTAC